MRRTPWIALPLLAACAGGTVGETPVPELSLELTSPTYGMFTGSDTVVVEGVVSPPNAIVAVERRAVDVDAEGRFRLELPMSKPYRIVDVQAAAYEQLAEARVPAFSGIAPRESFPGALGLRFTPDGLDAIGGLLEGLVVDLVAGLDPASLPAFGGSGVDVGVTGIRVGAVEADLAPRIGALDASIVIVDLTLDVEITADVFGNPVVVPGALTFPEVSLAGDLELGTDDAGVLVASLVDVDLGTDVPTVTLFDADLGFLSDLVAGLVDLDALLDGLGGDLGPFPLGGPLEFETDLLGTTLALALLELSVDEAGVGAQLGVGLDGPVPAAAADVPLPTGDFDPPVDLAVTLHDVFLTALLDSDLLSLLEQDIVLPEFLGGFFQPLVEGLPGGEQVPENLGWCIGIGTGDAKVARFGVGDGPLAGIYLPDATVTFATVSPTTGDCEDWLVTSLALEVLLEVTEGTKVSFGLAAPEGTVLSYGATGADEDEVVARLGDLLTSLLGLLGGFTEIDLADLLGGAQVDGLGDLSLEIGSSRPVLDTSGRPIDGMVEVGVDLFDTP